MPNKYFFMVSSIILYIHYFSLAYFTWDAILNWKLLVKLFYHQFFTILELESGMPQFDFLLPMYITQETEISVALQIIGL